MTHGHLLADIDPLRLEETYGKNFSKKFKGADE